MSSLQELILGKKIFIFDFDGTLVDSNPIKLKAFDFCFADEKENINAILAYCYGNHHKPRWEKFRHVYETILKRPFTKEVEERLLKKYEDVTTEAVISVGEIKGAGVFLGKMEKSHEMYLLSSTPDPILKSIVKARQWDHYFKDIKGAPVKKSDWIKDLLVKLSASAQDVLFFGDSQEDANSARDVGCEFVAVANALLEKKEKWFIHDYTNIK